MFSEELEMLIETAIADGEISEKERTILHKRAQKEGIDIEELDLIIDFRIAKKKGIKVFLLSNEEIEDMKDEVEVEDEVDYESTLKYFREQLNELENGEYDDELDENGKVKKQAYFIKRNTINNFIRNFNLPSDKKNFKELLIFIKSHNNFRDEYQEAYKDKYRECKKIVQYTFPNDEDMLTLIGKEKKEEGESKGFFKGLFGNK